jgi:hypothetical protein
MSSGNFFDSLVGCIKKNVSIEAENRMQEIFQDIELGKIDTSKLNWQAITEERYRDRSFTNSEVKTRFSQELSAILSLEEDDLINSIKNDVKDSVTEAETKNQIVKDTAEEISDLKKKLAPPEEVNTPDTADPNATVPPATEETPSTDNSEVPTQEEEPPEETGEDADAAAQETNEDVDPETADDGTDATPDVADDTAAVPEATVDTTKSGNIVINIQNAGSAEAVARKFVPILPRHLKESTDYDVNAMAVEFARATGILSTELKIRKDSLKLAISTENLTDKNEYLEKYNELDKKTTEALSLSNEYIRSLEDMGLTQNNRFRKDEVSFECAKNIVDRFINKTTSVSVYPKDYTSTENIIANAFDIMQLHRMVTEGKDKSLYNEYETRESAFYKNMINVDSPEVKNAALAVLKLGDVKVEDILSPNFVKEYKIDVWTTNFKDIKNVNDLVFDNVSKRLSETWGRDLTKEEQDIIRATTNEEDATEILPTEFEKFVVKFGKEALNASTENGRALAFTDTQRKQIKLKAKVFATIAKSLEYLQIVDADDSKALDKFLSV